VRYSIGAEFTFQLIDLQHFTDDLDVMEDELIDFHYLGVFVENFKGTWCLDQLSVLII
jgi:hypothetical protein